MANNEGREQLSREIDQLTDEDQSYVLGISQALIFAQETMNRPNVKHEKNPTSLEVPNKK
jgi:hypothetical protein